MFDVSNFPTELVLLLHFFSVIFFHALSSPTFNISSLITQQSSFLRWPPLTSWCQDWHESNSNNGEKNSRQSPRDTVIVGGVVRLMGEPCCLYTGGTLCTLTQSLRIQISNSTILRDYKNSCRGSQWAAGSGRVSRNDTDPFFIRMSRKRCQKGDKLRTPQIQAIPTNPWSLVYVQPVQPKLATGDKCGVNSERRSKF